MTNQSDVHSVSMVNSLVETKKKHSPEKYRRWARASTATRSAAQPATMASPYPRQQTAKQPSVKNG